MVDFSSCLTERIAVFRTDFRMRIYASLNGAHFTREDFEVAIERPEGATADHSFFIARYLYDERFFFKAQRGNQGAWVVSAAPGELTMEETIAVKGLDELFRYVSTWQERLWSELSHAPFARMVEEQMRRIEALEAQAVEVPDEPFSEREREEFKSRLKDLEEHLQQEINSRLSENEEVEKERAELRARIDQIEQQLAVSNKPTVFKMVRRKLLKFASSNGGRKLLVAGAKAALPEHADTIQEVDDSLPR